MTKVRLFRLVQSIQNVLRAMVMGRDGIRIIARIRPISLDDKDEKTASFKTSLLHLQCKTMLEDAFYTAKPQKVVFYTVKDVK